MLLGCCHCGEEPSESVPPSESASESAPSDSDSETASGSSETTFTGCNSCIDAIAPLRWKATIAYSGTTSTNGKCCPVYQQQIYYLTNDPSTCNWVSAEKRHAESNLGAMLCTEGTGAGDAPRVILYLTGTKLRLEYYFLYPTSGSTPSILRWEKNASAGSPINCLIGHTLNKVNVGFGSGWSGTAPCRTTQTIPATVTVEPA